MVIVLLVFQILFAIFFVYLCIAFMTGAPFVPSTNATAESMIKLAHIKKGTQVIDLGSGDGRLLFRAAERGAFAHGVEINPYLAAFTTIKALIRGRRSQVSVRCGDFWGENLTRADVIFIYLLPWKMDRLADKIKKEAKPGCLVVSNSFIFPNWDTVERDETHHVYVFKKNNNND
jgi:SAM-dependent methyltransferase